MSRMSLSRIVQIVGIEWQFYENKKNQAGGGAAAALSAVRGNVDDGYGVDCGGVVGAVLQAVWAKTNGV